MEVCRYTGWLKKYLGVYNKRLCSKVNFAKHIIQKLTVQNSLIRQLKKCAARYSYLQKYPNVYVF